MSQFSYYEGVVGPVFVQWENLFAVDKRRIVNGQRVGDDRYSITVLFGDEAAQNLFPQMAKAAAEVDATKAEELVLKSLKEVNNDQQEAGFKYRMKAYSNRPIDVVKWDGTLLAVPPIPDGEEYRSFSYGVKQGHKVHLACTFRGYKSPDGAGVSRYLNGVFLHADDPITLPGAKPSAQSLLGHLVDKQAKPPAAKMFAGMFPTV